MAPPNMIRACAGLPITEVHIKPGSAANSHSSCSMALATFRQPVAASRRANLAQKKAR